MSNKEQNNPPRYSGHEPAIEEALFDEADIADAATLEFENASDHKGLAYTLLRVVKRKRFLFACLLAVLTLAGFMLKQAGYLAPGTMFGFLHSHPLLAPLIFLVVYIVMTVLLLPTLPLNVGAGALWGPWWGGIYTVIGASLGAALAFLISRYLAADFAKRHFQHPTWVWLLNEIKQRNWKIVAFTRINPIFPTAPLNYFYGLTTVPFWSYFVSTIVFIAPMAILFAYLGDSVGGFLLRGESFQIMQNLLGVSAAVSVFFLFRMILKYLNRDR